MLQTGRARLRHYRKEIQILKINILLRPLVISVLFAAFNQRVKLRVAFIFFSGYLWFLPMYSNLLLLMVVGLEAFIRMSVFLETALIAYIELILTSGFMLKN